MRMCVLWGMLWDYFPAKSIAAMDKKIISMKPKFKKASKNVLHKILKSKQIFFRIANNDHRSKDNNRKSKM